MFEDSLLDGRVSTRRTRWAAVGAVSVQALVASMIVLVPLLHPETLPLRVAVPKMTSLSLRRPEVKKLLPVKPLPVKPLPVKTGSNAPHAPGASMPASAAHASGGQHLTMAPSPQVDGAPSLLAVGSGAMGGGVSGDLGLGGTSDVPSRVVTAAAARGAPTRISSGVLAGLLLAPIRPVYPRIAVAAGVEGTVVLTATIDKGGWIVGLQVVSGPEMLRSAASEAVRFARYKPYQLNGDPVEVVTTIAVTFRMHG